MGADEERSSLLLELDMDELDRLLTTFADINKVMLRSLCVFVCLPVYTSTTSPSSKRVMKGQGF